MLRFQWKKKKGKDNSTLRGYNHACLSSLPTLLTLGPPMAILEKYGVSNAIRQRSGDVYSCKFWVHARALLSKESTAIQTHRVNDLACRSCLLAWTDRIGM